MSAQIPTALFVEGHLANLTAKAVSYYFIQKGNAASGLILVKITNINGRARLLVQQRDFTHDCLVWRAALEEETVEERDADAYIKRAISRDPDLWVLEIEDETLANPFEEASRIES
ncbi:MAG TPA: DUF1491 family protein [Alphaproteobacteria bacterium]|nr:DUF1491 family protein [Alphaproteobacteria bacterium]USO06333.1 MAG: DUF1491 family protein [Rhodospirillales bacterium]HOO81140.1 DUF1491 family protein [Alphaproteobacteria bacterium]